MQLTLTPVKKSIVSLTTIAFALLTVFSLGSCARKMSFGISPIVPAAKGQVKIKKSKNNNYTINVSVTNLAPPKRLSPPREVYVVWMRTRRNQVKNIGMIKSSTGFLSSTLKGAMSATSTSKPTSIFITAEDYGNVQYPGSEVVLRTE